MPDNPKPSGVDTTETPRPPEQSVVTDELKESGQGSPAAADEAREADRHGQQRTDDGSNDQDSATGKSQDDDKQTQQPSKPKRDRHSEKRIRRLNRQLAAERDRNNANSQKIAELEQKIERLSSTQETPPEPKPDDFNDPKEYAKAWAKWDREHGTAAQSGSDSKAQDRGNGARAPGGGQPADRSGNGAQQPHGDGQGQRPTRQAGPSEEALTKFFENGKKRLGDEFLLAQEAASNDEFAVNQVMGDFILDSDQGAELFVYLSDHPELSSEIANLSETYAIKRLEELATKSKNGQLIDDGGEAGGGGGTGDGDGSQAGGSGGDDKSGQQQAGSGNRGEERPGGTKAPDPPSSGPDRADTTQRFDPEKADMEEYAAFREKQEVERLKGR